MYTIFQYRGDSYNVLKNGHDLVIKVNKNTAKTFVLLICLNFWLKQDGDINVIQTAKLMCNEVLLILSGNFDELHLLTSIS